jgi:hypothetical protein
MRSLILVFLVSLVLAGCQTSPSGSESQLDTSHVYFLQTPPGATPVCRVHASSMGSATTEVQLIYRRCYMDLKEQAAAHHCNAIYITSSRAGGAGGFIHMDMAGDAYRLDGM